MLKKVFRKKLEMIFKILSSKLFRKKFEQKFNQNF